MVNFEDRLNEILTEAADLMNKFKIELEHAPDGTLLHQVKRGQSQFLHSFYSDGKRVRRGVNRDTNLIRALAKKEFNRKAYEIINHNVTAVSDALDAQIPFDTDSILKSMSKAYSLLPEDYFFERDKLIIADGLDDELVAKIKRHEEWWKKPYKEYWGFPEYKTRTTSRGEKVRSISEMLIAEALYKYSIPFHYEEELYAGGKTYAPDFTFEGADYNNFYLDYFGMMYNAKYAKRNLLKLEDYYDIGLIPGGNLIVAFDCTGIMNAAVIEGIIKNEVIPRL